MGIVWNSRLARRAVVFAAVAGVVFVGGGGLVATHVWENTAGEEVTSSSDAVPEVGYAYAHGADAASRGLRENNCSSRTKPGEPPHVTMFVRVTSVRDDGTVVSTDRIPRVGIDVTATNTYIGSNLPDSDSASSSTSDGDGFCNNVESFEVWFARSANVTIGSNTENKSGREILTAVRRDTATPDDNNANNNYENFVKRYQYNMAGPNGRYVGARHPDGAFNNSTTVCAMARVHTARINDHAEDGMSTNDGRVTTLGSAPAAAVDRGTWSPIICAQPRNMQGVYNAVLYQIDNHDECRFPADGDATFNVNPCRANDTATPYVPNTPEPTPTSTPSN